MRTFFLIFVFALFVAARGEEMVCVEFRSSNQPPSKVCGYPMGKPDFQPRFSDNSRQMDMTGTPMKFMTEGKNCQNCGNGILPLPYAAAGLREGRTIIVPPMARKERSDCREPILTPMTFPPVHHRIIPTSPPQINAFAAAEEMIGRYFHLYDRVRQLEERLKIADSTTVPPNAKTPEQIVNPQKISSPEIPQKISSPEIPQKISSPEIPQKEAIQNPREPIKN